MSRTTDKQLAGRLTRAAGTTYAEQAGIAAALVRVSLDDDLRAELVA